MRREIKLEDIDIPLLKEFKDREGAKSRLEVKVTYVEGGTSLFTGNTVQRGYAVSFHAATITPDGSRMFTLFGGINKGFMIETAKRFDARRLAKLAETAQQHERYVTTRAECLALAGAETAAA